MTYQLLRASKINRLKKTADYFDIGKRERTESYVKDRIEIKPIDRVWLKNKRDAEKRAWVFEAFGIVSLFL